MNTIRPASRDDEILKLKLNTEKILENQMQMCRDIREIKKCIFDPDEGLYTRVGRNTQFRTAAARWLWALTTGMTLSLARLILNMLSK